MTVRVVGLDLSTASSGLTMPNGTCHTLRPKVKDDPARRLHEILVLLEPYLRLARADVATLEVPIIGRGGAGTFRKLSEVAGVVKARLHEHVVVAVDVPGASLKLFATGHGGAKSDKAAMVAAAVDAGAVVANDDEADSWWLWALGMYAYGERVVPERPYRGGVVGRIAWPQLTLREAR